VELEGYSGAEEALLAEFDLSGLALSEKDVVEHLDFGEEKSLPVSYKKDGTFAASSSVATREQFAALSDYVKKQLVTYGNEILDGNISIEPYKEEKRTACDYCDYKGICGFDPSFTGNKYRKIKKTDKKELWNQIEERR
jgi:ATP-dependent helicase/nuclease subunit B